MSRDSLHTRSTTLYRNYLVQCVVATCYQSTTLTRSSQARARTNQLPYGIKQSSALARARSLSRSPSSLSFGSSLGIILHDSPAFSARETRRVERRPPLPAGRRGSSCAPLGRLIARCSARQPGLVILGRGRHLSSSRDHLSTARLWKLCQATPWTAPD